MEIFEYLLKDPSGLAALAILIAVPSILSVLVVYTLSRRAGAQDKNVQAITGLASQLARSQSALHESQAKADERQTTALENQANAMMDIAQQNRTIGDLLKLNNAKFDKMHIAMDEQGNQILDAIASMSGLNVSNFDQLVDTLSKIKLGQDAITALVEGIQDSQKEDSEKIAVLADGLQGYNSRMDTLISQVTGMVAIINARLPSDTTPTIIS